MWEVRGPSNVLSGPLNRPQSPVVASPHPPYVDWRGASVDGSTHLVHMDFGYRSWREDDEGDFKPMFSYTYETTGLFICS